MTGRTPLHYAAMHGRVAAVEELVKQVRATLKLTLSVHVLFMLCMLKWVHMAIIFFGMLLWVQSCKNPCFTLVSPLFHRLYFL